jgi:hypothetical protein
MSFMRGLRYVTVGLGLAYLVPIACGSGGVVGGECKEGSPPDCLGTGATAGGSGNAGGSANTSGNTNTSGNRPGDAGNGTGASAQGGEGELTDGGIFDSPLDGVADGGPPLMCLPPHDSPSHCGDCDTRCIEPKPLCAPDGNGSFECVPLCDPPLVECQGQCVDPDSFKSDPDNCGSCGHECPSDICQDGKCVGARFGHIALLCMDFGAAAADSAPATLLGNALFVPTANPVHIMAYTRGASASAINRTNALIASAAGARGRQAQISDAKTPEAVTKNLNINDFQVLLIHDLDQATPGEPAAAATAWASAKVLSSFARAGGVIVVLDGSDGSGEMNELINAANLLDGATISSQNEIVNQQLFNNAPFDVVGVNVLSPFLTSSHTCTFDTDAMPSASTIFVVTDDESGGGLPVAIHRVIAP